LAAYSLTKPPAKTTVSPAVVAIGIVVFLGIGGFLYLERASRRPTQPPPPLSGAAKSYAVHYLPLSDVDMTAHESYMKQSLVEITGKIGNTGDRVVQVVELYCIFYDSAGLVVLRERVPIVTKKMGGLAPGETKPFRLAFDNIPESWNQAAPQYIIAGIEFS